jgi:hypothetical protein
MNPNDFAQVIDAITKLISVTAWPLVTAVIIFCFRKEIRKFLTELKAIGGPNLWAYLESPKGDRPSQAIASGNSTIVPVPTAFDKNKCGNAFWVGHDLLWTVAQLLSKGPREKILEGLFQSKHHLSEVGFFDSTFKSRLERIYQNALHTTESDWTAERRGQVATEIQSVAREIGGVIAANQPGFKSHPAS